MIQISFLTANLEKKERSTIKDSPGNQRLPLTHCFVGTRVNLHLRNGYTEKWAWITLVNYKITLHYRCHNRIYLLKGFYCEAAAENAEFAVPPASWQDLSSTHSFLSLQPREKPFVWEVPKVVLFYNITSYCESLTFTVGQSYPQLFKIR